jgi:hypothetical protein
LEKLKDFTHQVLVNDKPKLMDSRYHPFGTIELHVPTFQEGKFQGSYRIVGISYSSAMRVLKNHVKQLKRELAEIDESEVRDLIRDNNICGSDAETPNDLVAELKCDNLQLKAELRALQKRYEELERKKW